MEIKPLRPRKIFIEMLRKMTPEQRYMKSVELTEMVKNKKLKEFSERYPQHSQQELFAMYRDWADHDEKPLTYYEVWLAEQEKRSGANTLGNTI